MHKTRVIALLMCVLLWSGPAPAAKIRYTFDGWAGSPLRVYASRPAGLATDRPVVLVMHGRKRNADTYRDQWHDLAMKHDILLLVPEFSEVNFPGSNGYNLGYLEDGNGKSRPRARWSYSAVEPIFDDARRRFGMRTERYAIFGHSAGSQFVHRFVFHMPQARVSRAVVANAGWYMMPDYGVKVPYGLGGSQVTPDMAAAAMSMPLTVLLGDRDTDPEHPSLRRTPEAMAQGPHRLARGERFFETARAWSESVGAAFNWRLEYVPGAGHDNLLMAPAAIPFLLEDP